MDCANYSATLTGWSENENTPDSLSLGASGCNYRTDAVAARDKLITEKGWTITGDEQSLEPGPAGPISGEPSVCQGQTMIYSIAEITNADSYEWTLPEGASGSSTSNTISVEYTSSSVSGELSVKGMNDCGGGTEAIVDITVYPLPEAGWFHHGRNDHLPGRDIHLFGIGNCKCRQLRMDTS